jgi:hypothetical protein
MIIGNLDNARALLQFVDIVMSKAKYTTIEPDVESKLVSTPNQIKNASMVPQLSTRILQIPSIADKYSLKIV